MASASMGRLMISTARMLRPTSFFIEVAWWAWAFHTIVDRTKRDSDQAVGDDAEWNALRHTNSEHGKETCHCIADDGEGEARRDAQDQEHPIPEELHDNRRN